MAAASAVNNSLKVEYIQPFIDSLKLLFESHLGHSLEIGKPHLNPTGQPAHEMSGVIVFHGTATGRAILNLPMDVAEKLAVDFSQMDPLPDGLLDDCVGELANVVVGRAKASLQGHDITISPPTIVKGTNYSITPQRGAACLSIPCECKHGNVQFDISIVESS